MATITKRTAKDGATSYKVEIRLKGYPPQRATFTRLTDARQWAKETETDIQRGRHFKTAEAKRHTLADLVDRYAREVLSGKKAKTQGPQAGQLAWWKDQLGAYALADITAPLLAEHRDRLTREPVAPKTDNPEKAGLPRTRSPATVNRYLAVLSHAFTIAVKEWQWVESNPLLKVTKPKEPRGRVRFLSEDGPDGTPGERTRLLAACKASKSPDLYPAVVLALSTGARAQ